MEECVGREAREREERGEEREMGGGRTEGRRAERRESKKREKFLRSLTRGKCNGENERGRMMRREEMR